MYEVRDGPNPVDRGRPALLRLGRMADESPLIRSLRAAVTASHRTKGPLSSAVIRPAGPVRAGRCPSP